jgi:isoleucyl-tRNA synthetase
MNSAYWAQMIEVRSAVAKTLEKLRAEKVIGPSLSAEVTLYCQDDLLTAIDALQDELRFVLITSQATVKPLAQKTAHAVASELDGLWIESTATEHAKCARCWHHREEVGHIAEHPELCQRCVDNIAEDGDGEVRHYA